MYTTEGLTVEQIAEREKVSLQAVQDSIDIFKEYRFHHSNDMVALKMNEIVLRQLDQVGVVFSQGMKAKKYVPAGGGKFKNVDDTAMRLKTVDSIRTMIEVTQPKAPIVQNNTQFNNNGGGQVHHSGLSFEARLRTIRERKGLSNHEEEIIEDAAEAEEPESLREEMAGIGIDLKDGMDRRDDDGEDEDGDEEYVEE